LPALVSRSYAAASFAMTAASSSLLQEQTTCRGACGWPIDDEPAAIILTTESQSYGALV